MSKFTYKARNERGVAVEGVLECESREQAYNQLDGMGLIPISVKSGGGESGSLGSTDLLARFRKVKFDDLIFFTRQLQTIVRSGIPLNTGLKALEEQTKDRKLSAAIHDMYEDIDRGSRFSDALAKHKGVFSETYISMVRAGEEAGTLEEVLDRLSQLIEFQMRTKEMMKSAIRYPVMVVGTLAVAFLVMIKFVIPRFTMMFKGSKVPLPLPTKLLILISDLFQNYGFLIILGIVALVVLMVFYRKSKNGRLTTDRLVLQAPIIGEIVLKISMARFANMFENLVKTGVPIVRALDVVARTVGNEYIAQKIVDIAGKIEKGKGITKPMREAKVFPPLVIHLVATGEETGSLEEMLKEVSMHYDREVTYSVSRLQVWIEPILTLGLGGMVLFLALALFLPWWNMMGALKGGG